MKKRKFKKWFIAAVFNKYTYILYATIFCIGLFFGFFYAYVYWNSSRVVYISPLSQGAFAKASSHTTISSLNSLLKKAAIEFSKIEDKETYYKVTISKDSEVYFSKKINLEVQVTSLQLIDSRLTIEGKAFKRIDFRYDKPVMVLR